MNNRNIESDQDMLKKFEAHQQNVKAHPAPLFLSIMCAIMINVLTKKATLGSTNLQTCYAGL